MPAGRPSAERIQMRSSVSADAKYVRRTETDRWEYGTCRRVDGRMEYEAKGVKDTMREAEDANGMKQPVEHVPSSIYPTGPSMYYGPETLCSGKS